MFWHNINKSILSDETFQRYPFGWKKDLLKFFWIFLFNKWKIWWVLSSFWRSTGHDAQLIIVLTLAKITLAKPFLFFQKMCSWIAAVNQKEGTFPKNVYLCSDHFEEACFDKSWDIIGTIILHITSQEKKTCRWVDCCGNLDNENTLAIEMGKQFTEAAIKRCSTNLFGSCY